MDVTIGTRYQLLPRGAPGLACDDDGVALGAVPLVRTTSADGLGRSDVLPLAALAEILGLAYGPQPPEVTERCHRGLKRAAARLDAGDIVLACIEAVLIGFPTLTAEAMAKLARHADLEKSWEDQPRLPAGQSGGGQWTAEAAGGEAARPANDLHPRPAEPSSRPSSRATTTDHSAAHHPEGHSISLDDGVFHPDRDAPRLISTAGGAEDEEPHIGIGDNSGDFTSLEEVFPGLGRSGRELLTVLTPVDAFLGDSAAAEGANLTATEGVYAGLVAQIRAIDPSWRDDELQTLDQMSWQGRVAAINNLRMERAVAYYKIRGDIGPLQVETLRFLQGAVDKAYAEAVSKYDTGQLPARLSREEAIGNYVDMQTRQALRTLFKDEGIGFGPGQDITINNRDASTADEAYRVPDTRLRKLSIDWSLTPKTLSAPQIRGFFAADSEPEAVVIIRPRQLGPRSMYLIPRPAHLPSLR
jgi:hypothetical protein